MQSEQDRRTLEAYQELADRWDAESMPRFKGLEWSYFSSGLRPGAKVLDLGCGTAREVDFFRSEGYEYVGTDFSVPMLEAGRARLREEGYGSTPLIAMDMRRLAFKPESFDGFWCATSFMHLSRSELPAVLADVRVLLRPEGVGMFSVPMGEFEGFYKAKGEYAASPYCVCWLPDNLNVVLEATGYETLWAAEISNMLVYLVRRVG